MADPTSRTTPLEGKQLHGEPHAAITAGLSPARAIGTAVFAVVIFHAAYQWEACGILVVGYLAALFRLAWVKSARWAFYLGLAAGFLVAAPQLTFFYGIFGPAAIGLWLILGLWQAAFLLTAHSAVRRWPRYGGLWIPVIWLGVEYFRSELYYLRFSWLTPGSALSHPVWIPLTAAGVYGFSFITLLLLAAAHVAWQQRANRTQLAVVCAAVVLSLAGATNAQPIPEGDSAAPLVVGVQVEGASDEMLVSAMERAIREHPQLDILVLSEYAFDGPVPHEAREWCGRHEKHLIAGGKRYLDSSQADYENTTFVIGPGGQEVFRQVKSVPVQFMRDGDPATSQQVWNSPWGGIGIAICYDLSYSRVIDRLVRDGAQALIVPAMELAEWGPQEHRLHAKIAPLRAREYGIPILRVTSSGVSQFVNRTGSVVASVPFPQQNRTIAGVLPIGPRGGLPVDRYVAMPSVVVVALLMLSLWLRPVSSNRKGPISLTYSR